MLKKKKIREPHVTNTREELNTPLSKLIVVINIIYAKLFFN